MLFQHQIIILKEELKKCVISHPISKQSNGSLLCVEWPAVLVLLVWDPEQLLCLFFPDNLPNSMEKEGIFCVAFYFLGGGGGGAELK